MQGMEQPGTRHRQRDPVGGAQLGTKPGVALGRRWLPALLGTGNRLGLTLPPSFPQTSTHCQVKLGLAVCSWSLTPPLPCSHHPFTPPRSCGSPPAVPLLPPTSQPDLFFSMRSVRYFRVRTGERLTHMLLMLLSSSALPTLLQLYRKGQFCPNFFPACSSPFLCFRGDVPLPKQQLQHQKDLTQLSKSPGF